jgi:hypothetical protein
VLDPGTERHLLSQHLPMVYGMLWAWPAVYLQLPSDLQICTPNERPAAPEPAQGCRTKQTPLADSLHNTSASDHWQNTTERVPLGFCVGLQQAEAFKAQERNMPLLLGQYTHDKVWLRSSRVCS